MKKVISEINRYREIVGLSLINEGWIDDLIRKVLPDFDDILTRSIVTGDAGTLLRKIQDDSLGRIKNINGDIISTIDELAQAIDLNQLDGEAINMLIKNVMDIPSLRESMVDELISQSRSLMRIDDYIKNIDERIKEITGGKELTSTQLTKIQNQFKKELRTATYKNGTKLGDDIIEEFKKRIDDSFNKKIKTAAGIDREMVNINITQIVDELKNLPIGKELIKQGKYNEFSSRLEKLNSLLKNENEMRKLLGDAKYDQFSRSLSDFSEQEINSLKRFYLKNIDDRTGKFFSIVNKYMGITGVCIVAIIIISLIEGKLGIFDLPFSKHVLGNLSIATCEIFGGFCKEAKDYKDNKGYFATTGEETDDSTESEDKKESSSFNEEKFRTYLKEFWGKDYNANDTVKINGNEITVDDGKYVYTFKYDPSTDNFSQIK